MRWVVDDFLPQRFFHDIRDFILSKQFKWVFGAVVYHPAENGDTYPYMPDHEKNIYLDQKDDDWFLSRRIFDSQDRIQEQEWDVIRPIMYFIEDRLRFQVHELLRVQVNCMLNQNRKRMHGFHNDRPDDHYVALYYLNTSLGAPTVFEDGEEVEHIENRLLFFRGGDMFENKHSTNLPINTQRRAAININLKGEFF
jgi:hypothetical protein